MPTKRAKSSGPEILPFANGYDRRRTYQPASDQGVESSKSRNAVPAKYTANANEYLCAIERNQNGKYTVRVRSMFGPGKRNSENGRAADHAGEKNSNGWTLPVYFLASSFNAAMKKLEESLQVLQKNEERLRFWGVERTDDPNVASDLLQELGLWLDRRRDFPRKIAELCIPRERPVPASMLAPVRRVLADSVAQERPIERAALAGD